MCADALDPALVGAIVSNLYRRFAIHSQEADAGVRRAAVSDVQTAMSHAIPGLPRVP